LIGHLGATTLTAIHYIARRNVGTIAAHEMMKDLLQIFEVAPVNRAVLEGALALGFDDFEEAVSLLKNPSTPLPSTLQGLKNPAIAVFWP
jgi:hypothetical protein